MVEARGKNMNLLNINKMLRSKKGIFILEYVALVALVVLALLAMRIYLKGAVCGRFRSAADSFGMGRQYDPNQTTETNNW
jgi:Flp pilus assembly pilin Flp